MIRSFADVVKGKTIDKKTKLYKVNDDDCKFDNDKLYAKIVIIFKEDICCYPDYKSYTDVRYEYTFYDYDVINNIISKYGNYIEWYDCYHLPHEMRISNRNGYICDSELKKNLRNIIFGGPFTAIPKNVNDTDFVIKYIMYED